MVEAAHIESYLKAEAQLREATALAEQSPVFVRLAAAIAASEKARKAAKDIIKANLIADKKVDKVVKALVTVALDHRDVKAYSYDEVKIIPNLEAIRSSNDDMAKKLRRLLPKD